MTTETPLDGPDFPDGTVFVEIRGVYDGWCYAVLPDGTRVNRWPKDDRRHEPTQRVIDMEALTNDN